MSSSKCCLAYGSLPNPNKNQGYCHFSPTAIRILKYSVGLIVTEIPIGYAFLMLAKAGLTRR